MYNFFVGDSTIVAAFFGMIVHQVSLQWTVSNYRCVEFGRTPLLFLLLISAYNSYAVSTYESIQIHEHLQQSLANFLAYGLYKLSS